MKSFCLYFVLVLLVAACNVNVGASQVEVGQTQTLMIDEPGPAGADVVDLIINMGAGELNLTGGAAGLVEGEVRYNVAEWAPTVESSGSAVIINQGNLDGDGVSIPLEANEVVNVWDLRLGGVPLNLDINAGAYKGHLDLSGVPLRSLDVHDGASDSDVIFNEVNPEAMDALVYETGASSITLQGLANANFGSMQFKSGVGDYTLDFSGELQRDASVTVESGVSNVRVVVPEGTAAQVTSTSSLTNVTMEGGWTQAGSTYALAGDGPALTISVEVGAGALTLANE